MDYSLFIYHAGPIHIFLLIYIDDVIITGNYPTTINLLIDKLQYDFALKDLGDLSYFLGIQAVQNPEGLHLRQSKYIIDLLNHVNMTDSKPYRAPCMLVPRCPNSTVKLFRIPHHSDTWLVPYSM